MSEEVTDDSYVDARRDQVHSGRVAHRVRGCPFSRQRRRLLRRRPDLLAELESHSGSSYRSPVFVRENRFSAGPWLPFEQTLQQLHRFWPERT